MSAPDTQPKKPFVVMKRLGHHEIASLLHDDGDHGGLRRLRIWMWERVQSQEMWYKEESEPGGGFALWAVRMRRPLIGDGYE